MAIHRTISIEASNLKKIYKKREVVKDVENELDGLKS